MRAHTHNFTDGCLTAIYDNVFKKMNYSFIKGHVSCNGTNVNAVPSHFSTAVNIWGGCVVQLHGTIMSSNVFSTFSIVDPLNTVDITVLLCVMNKTTVPNNGVLQNFERQK
jgi:hypothetical protein